MVAPKCKLVRERVVRTARVSRHDDVSKSLASDWPITSACVASHLACNARRHVATSSCGTRELPLAPQLVESLLKKHLQENTNMPSRALYIYDTEHKRNTAFVRYESLLQRSTLDTGDRGQGQRRTPQSQAGCLKKNRKRGGAKSVGCALRGAGLRPPNRNTTSAEHKHNREERGRTNIAGTTRNTCGIRGGRDGKRDSAGAWVVTGAWH